MEVLLAHPEVDICIWSSQKRKTNARQALARPAGLPATLSSSCSFVKLDVNLFSFSMSEDLQNICELPSQFHDLLNYVNPLLFTVS